MSDAITMIEDIEIGKNIESVGGSLSTLPERRSDGGAFLEMIERASRDASVDIDKMERLMSMYERVRKEEAKTAYVAALSKMQPDLPEAPERGAITNKYGQVQSNYALWEDVTKLIKPVLANHGFALSFRTVQDGGTITVTGILSHRDGHTETSAITLPADTSGSKNSVQAVGSSISYGQRYTAKNLLNLTSRGEDDDGKNGCEELVTDEQVMELQTLAEDVGAAHGKFLSYMGVSAYADIPRSRYAAAVAALEKKRETANA